MTITSLPSLLGIFALAFLLLLMAKVVKQPAADKTAKQLLILLLVGLISMAFCLFYIYAGMFQYWPRLSVIEIGFVYWIGPSLYFYVRRLAGGPSPFASPLNLLHWLPALLIELMLTPYFLLSPEEKLALREQQPGSNYSWMIWAIWLGFHVHVLVYIYFCQPLLRVYRQRIMDNYSDISLINLRWLQLLCYGFLVQILIERLAPFFESPAAPGLSNTAGMTVYLFIIALAYSALGQSRLQFASDRHQTAAAGNGTGHENGNGKYHRSGLRDDSAQYYVDKLNKLMATERYYLDGNLSLQALAGHVKLSPHHLSQILNEQLKKNFYDYINEQRVDYAKQLLVKEPQKPITDIAFASGYNSKNSFYNAFKRHAGMTPSDYRSKASAPANPA